MKIVTVIGARPQFIKAAVLSRYINNADGIEEVIVHTGQHFDNNMSEVFFNEMGIPNPKYHLEINSLNHGAMTGRMLEKIEEILLLEKPDFVLVYGDTNSTLAGALAAKKLHIKLVHVEAGLRSLNLNMPEEINRILTDRISDVLFCPSEVAINNLHKEGFAHFNTTIVNSGDIMLDAALLYSAQLKDEQIYLQSLGIAGGEYVLATIHREENTNNAANLKNILDALAIINRDKKVVIPLHPRTKNKINELQLPNECTFIEPVGYLEMLTLTKNSYAVLTDSGGLQKEAFFLGKQCITLREETEWIELVEGGYNSLVGSETDCILEAYSKLGNNTLDFSKPLYGRGNTASIIVNTLLELI